MSVNEDIEQVQECRWRSLELETMYWPDVAITLQHHVTLALNVTIYTLLRVLILNEEANKNSAYIVLYTRELLV